MPIVPTRYAFSAFGDRRHATTVVMFPKTCPDAMRNRESDIGGNLTQVLLRSKLFADAISHSAIGDIQYTPLKRTNRTPDCDPIKRGFQQRVVK